MSSIVDVTEEQLLNYMKKSEYLPHRYKKNLYPHQFEIDKMSVYTCDYEHLNDSHVLEKVHSVINQLNVRYVEHFMFHSHVYRSFTIDDDMRYADLYIMFKHPDDAVRFKMAWSY